MFQRPEILFHVANVPNGRSSAFEEYGHFCLAAQTGRARNRAAEAGLFSIRGLKARQYTAIRGPERGHAMQRKLLQIAFASAGLVLARAPQRSALT